MGGSATISSSTFMAGDGDGYELQMGRFSRLLAPLFVDFAGINEGRRILDVGCGTGSLTFELARNPGFERIEAVDFSPIYVAHAKVMMPASHFGRPMPARSPLRMPHLTTRRRCLSWRLFPKLIK